MAIYDQIKAAMGDLDEDEVVKLVKKALESGGVKDALAACQDGLSLVGSRFEGGEYFVSDLIYAGDVMGQAMEILKPGLATEAGAGTAAKVIICTVKSDLHDIGKNIVKSLLEASNFEVIDLGIDVAPETIVAAAKKDNVKIIALSGVLTMAIDSMKETVEAFKKEGMRDNVKIIIGGSPITAEVSDLVGSDAWSQIPQEGVKICLDWAS